MSPTRLPDATREKERSKPKLRRFQVCRDLVIYVRLPSSGSSARPQFTLRPDPFVLQLQLIQFEVAQVFNIDHLITRFVDPEVAGRYGTSVYVRCGAETAPGKKKAAPPKTAAAKKT